MTICGCSRVRVVPSPPEVIRIPQYLPLPKECGVLQAITLQPGSTAQDAIEEQHAAILRYETLIAACFSRD